MGQHATRSMTASADRAQTFEELSGDYNPLPFDETFAKRDRFDLGVCGRWLVVLALGVSACRDAPTPVVEPDLTGLVTRAEATDYAETTSYDEVVAFLETIDGVENTDGTRFHLTTFGETQQGRTLPLMVVGPVADARAETVRNADRLTVWLQGTIHGGEVCGKEALLMLLRALASGSHSDWAHVVLLVAPVYNADGNEAMSFDNRPLQHGPVGGMGQRRNAQDLDLNRDHTKLESPEARALIAALDTYDPDVIIDLHTTNGTQHGYHLTYAPPLHPATHPIIDTLLRDEWLPAVTRRVTEAHGWHYYYYGNIGPRVGPDRGWRTFDHRPRFNNNYAGLRNRFGILSEAYAYATFEDRVLASLWFVQEVLTFASEHSSEIRTAVETADSESVVGRELALRAVAKRSETPVPIRLGQTIEESHPVSGAPILRRTDDVSVEEMFEYGRFDGTVFAVAPAAYYVPAALTSIVEHLGRHGVRLSPIEDDLSVAIEEFRITASTQTERSSEGHRERTLEGTWQTATRRLPAGTLVVELDQPLGRLAFALIEPESDDGLVNWNMLDDTLEGAEVYPIVRAPAPPVF